MFKNRALRFALGLAVVLSACRESEVQSCLKLASAHRYKDAATRCAAAFESTGDPRAGAAVVRAHYFLGHDEETVAWVERLAKGRKVEPGLWSIAGAIRQKKGRFEEAERAYRSDVAVCQAAGDHRHAADSLLRLFNLSRGRSGYHETFLLAGEHLQEATKTGDPALRARAAEALYVVLFDVGDLAAARRALEATQAWAGALDRKTQARLLNNLGTVLAAEGRVALARRDFERALELGTGGTEEFFRSVHLNLVEILLGLGDVERASEHLAEAWKHAEPGVTPETSLLDFRAQIALARGDLPEAEQALTAAFSSHPEPEWAWDLEYRQGLLAELRGDRRAAEEAYEKSIGIVEEMRRTLLFDELKTWLLDRQREPFEALFLLQARSGRARDALATAERAQARTLLDSFLHASSAAGAPASKAWSAAASLARLEGLESLLPAMNESPVAALQPIGQVLDAFGNRHGLEYFEAANDLWLIVVGRQVNLRLLAAPASEVRRLADTFIARPDDSQTAEKLGNLLFPPGSLPRQGETVHLVADGILGNVPFAALRPKGRYLVESHPLASIPSLSVLAALEKQRGATFRPPLVLADPRGDLPAAAVEGLEVAGLLGADLRSGSSASVAEFRHASSARAFHLATHTGLGPRGAWLQLADGRVNAGEIVAGRINPRLAVLASCASGARPSRQMWGSLGAAFLAAGSRAVLASLWSVEDAPTRDLLYRFYAQGGASNPVRALARAQRVAIGQGRSPKVWAPFVLLGSDQPLDEVQ